jgi:hypothetical protein
MLIYERHLRVVIADLKRRSGKNNVGLSHHFGSFFCALGRDWPFPDVKVLVSPIWSLRGNLARIVGGEVPAFSIPETRTRPWLSTALRPRFTGSRVIAIQVSPVTSQSLTFFRIAIVAV